MKENIPTRKITVGKGEEAKEIEIYEWMTQDEENEYQGLLFGETEADESTLKSGEFRVKLKNLLTTNKFLVEHLCKDLKWEDFNTWNPELRAEVVAEVGKVREGVGKKS